MPEPPTIPETVAVSQSLPLRLDADLLERLRDMLGGARPPAGVPLSPREQQVIAMIAEGASDKHIARLLWISMETVKSHVKRSLQKTGAHNRAQLVAIMARMQQEAATERLLCWRDDG